MLSDCASKQKKVVTKKSHDDSGMKQSPIFSMPNLGTTLDMSNYHYKFNLKRLSMVKDKDAFIKFYQENSMLIHMIEYCEYLNPESIKTGAVSVDTACDFFAYLSVSYEEDGKYNRELNKTKEIIEDSFHDFPSTLPPSGLSNDECKLVFDRELSKRVLDRQYKYAGETYQEQF